MTQDKLNARIVKEATEQVQGVYALPAQIIKITKEVERNGEIIVQADSQQTAENCVAFNVPTGKIRFLTEPRRLDEIGPGVRALEFVDA